MTFMIGRARFLGTSPSSGGYNPENLAWNELLRSHSRKEGKRRTTAQQHKDQAVAHPAPSR